MPSRRGSSASLRAFLDAIRAQAQVLLDSVSVRGLRGLQALIDIRELKPGIHENPL